MAAFGPLVRKFIVFLSIASWASNYEVGRIIRTTARQRHNMLNVVGSPACSQFLFAIVTFVPLLFKHAFNIIGSEISSCLRLTGTTPILHSLV